MSDLVDDLAREMSFVLAQKVSFIQEDRVVTDTTDANAIKNRLSASTARKPVRKTVTTAQVTLTSMLRDLSISRCTSTLIARL